MVYLFGCFGFTWLKLEFCNYINFKIGRNQQENLDILKNCLHYCKMLKKSKLYLIAFSMVGPFIITPTWSTFFFFIKTGSKSLLASGNFLFYFFFFVFFLSIFFIIFFVCPSVHAPSVWPSHLSPWQGWEGLREP